MCNESKVKVAPEFDLFIMAVCEALGPVGGSDEEVVVGPSAVRGVLIFEVGDRLAHPQDPI